MSNWNNLKQAFQRITSNPDVKSFLSSPVTKIIAFNTGLFVIVILLSCCGASRESPRHS